VVQQVLVVAVDVGVREEVDGLGYDVDGVAAVLLHCGDEVLRAACMGA
jgi:hypothetical protein